MRMWMINPSLLCNNHLLGEHKELHMIIGSIKKNKNFKFSKYITNGLVEIHNIKNRHDELIKEFKKRNWKFGHNHLSIINDFNTEIIGKIDIDYNLKDLYNRCIKCRKLQHQYLEILS